MPCVEIADAIVQTGRETLERAKNTIESRPEWGAIVRYGDTDSLFVHLPGKTKDEAFEIGNEIADTITRMNPKPVKLKFEKVYLPSFLLAKKRYVGFKYESQKDKEPEFDAKVGLIQSNIAAHLYLTSLLCRASRRSGEMASQRCRRCWKHASSEQSELEIWLVHATDSQNDSPQSAVSVVRSICR